MLLVPLLGIFLPAVVVGFNLTILHTNDIHARFEQTNKYSGQCQADDVTEGKCFGGTARLVTKVREQRLLHPNTILLSAGDEYSGTLWFYKYRGAVVARFMNLLQYDVMTLGNHEFDLGIDGLIPLLNDVNFTVASANIDATAEPRVNNKLVKHTVLTVDGEGIGIIGYTSRETPSISVPGQNLKFEDEVVAVQREVDSLMSQGINKIIALGHSGFDVDQRIAAEVNNLDVVVGGHTNTFLYTGDHPSNEEPEGVYPHVVTQSGGAKVLVVQDYAYGKYLGALEVTFDPEGVITSWGGNPILLDNNTAQDEAILKVMRPYREGVADEMSQVVARSQVLLDGERSSCRVSECNLGNLIADAMVHQNLQHSDSLEWNHVALAFMNGGGIRTSIQKGDVTFGDITTVLPFRNTFDIVELLGKHVRESLEFAVSKWAKTGSLSGAFLQVSGLKVVYDVTMPVGQRVIEVKVRCTNCSVPHYVDLEDTEVYKIIMPSFTANGGDGYDVINKNKIKHHLLGDVDSYVLLEYVKTVSPLTHGLEGRISFRQTPLCNCPVSSDVTRPTTHLEAATATVLLLVVSTCIRGTGFY
ncbi:snake venom 5'-nucleotidase-like [Haliotis rufescens]|uniref:snake venom 5'-nucleotidase-like n=1 Tax=Haliotis rufescens TaxID=6454 RepID=UPI00201F06B2|nr:snake venom 5'-nucleotidase-like [Haliotis rufescens]